MKLQNNLLNCDGLAECLKHTPPSTKRAEDNFATGNDELWKVIADIAQRDGNVLNLKVILCKIALFL